MILASRSAALAAAAAIALFIGGCGDSRPTTYVTRHGRVVAGVWECPEPRAAKTVLQAWLQVAIPPDDPVAPANDDDHLLSLLPPNNAIQDWEKAGPAQLVNPDRLSDFLRRSDADYVAFGVRAVLSAEYLNRNLGKQAELRVDVFDMGSPENAFGFYTQRRLPRGTLSAIGAQASVGMRELYAWEDRYHFYVTIYEHADDTREALITFARHVADHIVGVTDPPTLVEGLWGDGVVPWSHRWFRTAEQARVASKRPELLLMPLGPDVRGTVAQIALRSELESEGFCAVFPTEEGARRALESLRTGLSDVREITKLSLGDEGFRARPRIE